MVKYIFFIENRILLRIYSSWIFFIFNFSGLVKIIDSIRKYSSTLLVVLYYIFLSVSIGVITYLLYDPIAMQLIHLNDVGITTLFLIYIVGLCTYFTKSTVDTICFQKGTHLYKLIQDVNYIKTVRFSLLFDALIKFLLPFNLFITLFKRDYLESTILFLIIIVTQILGILYSIIFTKKALNLNKQERGRIYDTLPIVFTLIQHLAILLPKCCHYVFRKDVKRFYLEGLSIKYTIAFMLLLISNPLSNSLYFILGFNMSKLISFELLVISFTSVLIIIMVHYFLKEFLSLSSEKLSFKIYNQLDRVYFKLFYTRLIELIIVILPLWIASVTSRILFNEISITINFMYLFYEISFILAATVSYLAVDFIEPNFLPGLFIPGPVRSMYRIQTIIGLTIVFNFIMATSKDISNGFEIFTVYLMSILFWVVITISIYKSYLRLNSATRFWYGGYYYDKHN